MSPRRLRGFTLLEVTVTLAILGVVMSIVFGVFAQTIAGKERAESRGEELASARAVLARISSDLTSLRLAPAGRQATAAAPQATPTPSTDRGLVRPESGLFLGRIHGERGLAIDDIAFSAFLRRPTAVTFAASDLGIVHYFVDARSENAREHGLYRETIFSLAGEAFDPDEVNLGATMLLLPGVIELDFRYFDGKDWVESWDSTDSRNFGPAPYAVEIRLTVANERGETETYQTAVDLPTNRTPRNPQIAPPPTPAS